MKEVLHLERQKMVSAWDPTTAKKLSETWIRMVQHDGLYFDWLVGFYGISTFVGYLTPNPFLCK